MTQRSLRRARSPLAELTEASMPNTSVRSGPTQMLTQAIVLDALGLSMLLQLLQEAYLERASFEPPQLSETISLE